MDEEGDFVDSLGDGVIGWLVVLFDVFEMGVDKGWGVVTLTESKEIFCLSMFVEFLSTEGLDLNRLETF